MQNQNNEAWTIAKLLTWSTSYFESNKIDSPRATSEILLSHILDLDRIDLYVQFDRPMSKDELSSFKKLVKRRLKNEPVAYITGKKGFWSHEFHVTEDTLIPRPDTECIVEEVINDLNKREVNKPKVLELGTGTGAIIISIQGECSGEFFASDISINALEIAKKNAGEFSADISFYEGCWFEPFDKDIFRNSFDIIISNPPYIPSEDITNLAPEINKFEPISALDGGPDGLDDLKAIIDDAPGFLKKGGTLYLEMGFDQGESLTDYALSKGCFENIRIIKDLGNNPRVASMTLS